METELKDAEGMQSRGIRLNFAAFLTGGQRKIGNHEIRNQSHSRRSSS